MTNDSAGDIVREIIECAWNLGELEVIDRRIATSFVRHTSRGDLVGPQVFKDRIWAVRAAFDGFHTQIHDIGGRQDQAYCRYSVSGRHTGTFLGFEPTGRDVEFDGAVIAHSLADQLIEEWEYVDAALLAAQLGAHQP
ncbi:ester cyclase [Mycobacterium decipiens]|uniref:ester cyclase n=1 Tax=Mycobacterium decipiens TaxID=1430326 RepID=UPI0013FE3C2E|nr:ester cyclase [Mycobacterium decipiens]